MSDALISDLPRRASILMMIALHACVGMAADATVPARVVPLAFQSLATAHDLDAALAAARKDGRPTLLYFKAEWCASCKQLDLETFPDPVVRVALEGYQLLSVDMTEIEDADPKLLKRFAIAGLPVMILFNARGSRAAKCNVVGFANAKTFAERLARCRD
jgi:thiol:disulfide interchange protein DsbD